MDPESLMDDSAMESSLNNCDSDLETPGSTSEISTPARCRAQCCDLDEPIQVKDKNAIRSTQKLQGKKWRQFSPDWYKSYPWLVLCTTRSKALCMYCSSCSKRGLLTARGGDAFLTTGFDNWKKAQEYFIQHEKSIIHREAVLNLELMKQPTVISQLSTVAAIIIEISP